MIVAAGRPSMGKDRLRDERGGTCRSESKEAGRGFQSGNEQPATCATDALLARTRQFAASARWLSRRARFPSLTAAALKTGGSENFYRRQSITGNSRTAGQGAPIEITAGYTTRADRLLAAGAIAEQTSKGKSAA